MLESIIIASIVLAFVHFVYESIMLPSIRLQSRLRLFALRDELRELTIDHQEEVNNAAFSLVEDSVNKSIAALSFITLTEVLWYQISTADEASRAQHKKRLAILEDTLPRVKEIYYQVGLEMLKVSILNSTLLVIYLMPVSLSILVVDKCAKAVRGWFSWIARALSSVKGSLAFQTEVHIYEVDYIYQFGTSRGRVEDFV